MRPTVRYSDTMTTTTNPYDTGRDIDFQALVAQIGRMTYGAICGFRKARRLGPSTIEMVVGNGYRVRVTLAADDTYTVERVVARSGNVKGRAEGVYCDQISDVAYAASCDGWEGFAS